MSALQTAKARLVGEGRAGLGLAAILVFAGLLAISATGAYRLPFSPDRDTVSATFAGTARLQPGDPVRIDGVEVGEVEEISPAGDAPGGTVAMKVDRSVGRLYADASAAIKWRTLLGGSFVVELKRGTRSAGALGSNVIPERRTSTQVEVEDFISPYRGRAKAGLRTMFGELARAYRDPDAPARLLRTLDDVAPEVERGVGATRGERLDRDLRTLVSASARTVRALDTPTDDMQGMVEGAAATFETTAAREADLRRLIGRAPGVMRRTDRTLDRLDTTLRLADPLLARLRRPAERLAPTLASLRPVAVDGDRLLRGSVPLMRSLRPAVISLARAARDGVPLLDDLAPGLKRLDEKILPFMGEIDPKTGHSASQMIGPAYATLGPAAMAAYDRNGHYLRFPSAVGPNTVQTTPCQPLLTNPDRSELLACDSLQQALQDYFTYNPLGPAGGSTPSSGRGGAKP